MTPNESNASEPAPVPPKLAWEPMKLSYLGFISELVLAGEGKLSGALADTGEPLKKPSPTPG